MKARKTCTAAVLLITALILTAGCGRDRRSGKGLILPDGDIEQGKAAFIDLECHRCHTVAGVQLPEPALETPLVTINLGGGVYRVKTYGELVTSIIHPDHIVSPVYLRRLGELTEDDDAESPMPSINERMTVAQLIDIVMFLDSRYKKLEPAYQTYPRY